MTTEFRLPDLGENVTEGEVVKVLVKEGDTVAANQPVIELETDKALLEVPAPSAGRVTKVHVAAGRRLKVDEMILTIEGGEAAEDGAGKTEQKPATSAREKTSTKGTAKKQAAEAPPEKPSSPATASTEAPVEQEEQEEEGEAPEPEPTPAPKSKTRQAAPSAAEPEPEQETEEAESAAESSRPPRSARVVEFETPAGQHVPASPSTRKLARELGVDLAKVKGSGDGGRVTQEDVKAYLRSRTATPKSEPARVLSTIPTPPLPDFSKWGPIERKPLSNIRKKTMQQLSLAWSLIPHVTQFDEVDVTDLEALRERHGSQAKAKGGKLTATVFVMKAVVAALKEFPNFNASLDPESEEIILKNYYHLGIAVDTEHGLMVPVIRDVDEKRLLELSTELAVISERARTRKVSLEDLHGSTFTITNLGGLGGTAFTPIINYPEVAILGLARYQKRLVFRGERMETRTMLPLCLSYDHRIIDGADAVRFTRKIATMLEDPALLLLEP